MAQFSVLKLAIFSIFIGFCLCDIYYTTPTSNEIYWYNFTTHIAKSVAKSQASLSKITNNRYNLFWISGKNIMKNTKGYWLDVVVFAKTDITFDKYISAMYASKNALYWSIGNKIYTLDIFGTTPTIFYQSSNPNAVILSIVFIEEFNILLFANSTTFLYLFDLSDNTTSTIDYSNSLKPDCGVIYDIKIVGGSFFMVTYGQSSGYGCVFKGVVQDIMNLNLYQKSGVSKFNLLDIAINATSILSLHPNTNCLTSLFMDYPKFCIPDSLGYFGGVTIDSIF